MMRNNRLFRPLLAAAAALAMASLPVERFAEAATKPPLKRIPPGSGFSVVTEAVATEYGALMDMVRKAVRDKMSGLAEWAPYYPDIEGIWPDKVVVEVNGRCFSFPYTLKDDNTIALGDPVEVVPNYTPTGADPAASAAAAAAAGGGGDAMSEARLRGTFTEAAADGSIQVTLIRAGLSKNGNFYPDAALQAAVPLFEGVRVFAKSDSEHTAGGGKDVRNLLGGVFDVRFVTGQGSDGGALVGTFRPIDPADPVVTKMTEAVRRGLQSLMGLSIDASARTKREQRDGASVRVAQKFVKVNSVDLIVEPGAGGGLDRLAEAATDSIHSTEPSGESMFKKRLLEALAAINAARAAAFNVETASEAGLMAALREAAVAAKLDVGTVMVAAAGETAAADVARLVEAARGGDPATRITEADAPVTRAELEMFRVRSAAALRLASCSLPAAARERLQAQFNGLARFTEADVEKAITDERAYLARFTESGTVRLGDGSRIEVQDRRVAMQDMLDAFFDPTHANHRQVQSFKECYIEMTGDKRVTGMIANCDRARLRESLGSDADGDFREAVSAGTFGNALGNSITRRMLAVYGQQTDLQSWRRVATVVPVNDFRSQERVTLGGYGNLPTVAEAAGYTALTSPSDLKATYAATKRGGLETVTLETIKNDDVGVLRRIPTELALAAANTLYEFVFDFFRTNPTIYDAAALYTGGRGNLFVNALTNTEFAAHRLAMTKFTRLSSSKRRGVTPKTLVVPFDLQETAFNLFQRNQNLDKTFVNSLQPDIIVVAYWTDTNDWVTVADPMVLPVLEIGFLDGQEDPQLFQQDMPNVGSMFSNDQLTYKIRHIYGGNVLPEGDKGTTKAVVP